MFNAILLLGGTVTDEITQRSVLVTDKIRCTMKILSAIARGCPIVNTNWLKHSYTVKKFQGFFLACLLLSTVYNIIISNFFVDVDDFIIVDKDAERKYNFQLKESLAKAKTKRLLDGYYVLVTPSVKPGPQEMKGSVLLIVILLVVTYNLRLHIYALIIINMYLES